MFHANTADPLLTDTSMNRTLPYLFKDSFLWPFGVRIRKVPLYLINLLIFLQVLIQESGERRFIAIGVVTKNYEIHKFPGWEGNTAGYHIDDGKIFDSAHSKLGKEGDGKLYK